MTSAGNPFTSWPALAAMSSGVGSAAEIVAALLVGKGVHDRPLRPR